MSFHNMSVPSVCNILDFPDEILVEIVLRLDARERLALGKSCQKFNDLVFRDEKLLRNLDFTSGWQLTKESDILEYFNDENTYKKILRINAEKVWAVSGLSSSIGKAINLVDLNVLSGLHFHSVEELSCFLKPLVHLKRLSVDWPEWYMQTIYGDPNWNELLEEPLSRLTYLSLETDYDSNDFLLILQLCQRLEELRLIIPRQEVDWQGPLRSEPMKLSNLKFVRLVSSINLGRVREDIMRIVPDPAEWTDYWLIEEPQEIYLERNVEVCAELSQIKEMPLPEYVELHRQTGPADRGWPLVFEHLLSEVIRITHEDAPQTFCCLSRPKFCKRKLCLLEIDEAKKLLKDPEYQISYLQFSYLIEKNCDAHLLASAFPNLTTLVLPQISNRNSTSAPERTTPLRRHLRKRGSVASEEEHSDERNTDSSFKMLIANTPRLKVLEISPDHWENKAEHWDLDALYLISGWKNLKVIRLCDIPITDGKFLIDIGKECKKLEEVTLRYLGPDKNCSWESELLQMLKHCKNLRMFSICQNNLGNMSKIFDTLSNNSELRHVRFITRTESYDSVELVSSIERMLRRCPLLTKLVMLILSFSNPVAVKLKPGLQRVVCELNRPNFEFYGPVPPRAVSHCEDLSDLLFADPLDDRPFV